LARLGDETLRTRKKKIKMKLWTVISLALCALALFAVTCDALKMRKYIEDEPMWIEEPFVMEGARTVREEGGSPNSRMGVLKRLNPKKRFQYATPFNTDCPATSSNEINECFSYFKSSSDQVRRLLSLRESKR
jgi:hypothetical protein